MTSGATGASGERDWNSKIVPMIADRLILKGVEVHQCDALANKDVKVTSTDWDLFLAVHYDADIYNDNGGFVDYPDASVDKVWERSKYLAQHLTDHYFSTTKIPYRPQRSNANTKFYYMWSALTDKTPCVIIECGVGNRKPEDYTILRDYELISKTIADGVLIGLGLIEGDDEIQQLKDKIKELDDELDDMRTSRDKWKRMYEELEESHVEEIKKKDILIDQYSKQASTFDSTIIEKDKMITNVTEEKNRYQDAYNKCYSDFLQYKSDKEIDLVAIQNKLTDCDIKIKKLQKKIDAGLKGYTKRELIIALFRKG